MMITGDALLDFGDGHKIKRSAKPGWYIYHSLARQSSGDIFSSIRLEKWRYDSEYKVSSDYALAAKMYKAGYVFKTQWLVSEFSMGGVSTTNNMELCADAKKSPTADIARAGFWAELSGIYANVRPQRRKPYITKAEYKGNDAGFKWILGAERVPGWQRY